MADPTPAELRALILEVVDLDPQRPLDVRDIASHLWADHYLGGNMRRVARNVAELVRRGELAWAPLGGEWYPHSRGVVRP